MIALFLFSTLSWSTPFAWLPGALQVSPSAIRCESSPDDLKQRCAQDLCGLPGTNPSVFIDSGSLEGFTPTAEIQAEITRVERDMDRATAQWRARVDQFLDETTRKLSQPSIDPREITGVADFFSPYVSYQVEGERIRLVTDFPADMDPVLQAGVTEWVTHQEELAQQDRVLRLTLGLDSLDETMNTLRSRSQTIVAFLNTPAANFQIPAVQLNQIKANFRQINELLSQEAPPIEFMRSIDQFMAQFEGVFRIQAPTQFPPITAGLVSGESNRWDSSCRENCLRALESAFSKSAIEQRILRLRERLNTERDALLSGCRTGLLLQAQLGQLPQQRERAMGLVESALTKIQSAQILSSESSSDFSNMIRENTDVETSFPSELLAGADFLNAFSEMANARLLPSVGQNVEENLAVLIDLTETPGNLYGRDFRGCPSPRHVATDFFWPGIQRPLIHVSPHSCAHPQTGEGVVAHELGHALSHFIRAGASETTTSNYFETRECVVTLSPILPMSMPDGALQIFAMDRLTTEEDMADWLMSRAVGFQEHPITCDFLKTADDGHYDPAFIDILPHDGDNHSGNLMRMIREWQAKHNSLPSSCQQLLTGLEGVVEARRCE